MQHALALQMSTQQCWIGLELAALWRTLALFFQQITYRSLFQFSLFVEVLNIYIHYDFVCQIMSRVQEFEVSFRLTCVNNWLQYSC